MSDTLQQQFDVLRAELDAVNRELEAVRLARRRSTRRLAVVALVAAAWAGTAFGATDYLCSSGALPLTMFCFDSDQPAIASRINGNFKQLGDDVVALQGASVANTSGLSTTNTALSTLTNRVLVLETAMTTRPRVLSGSQAHGVCGQSGVSNCTITFPTGYFNSAPKCVTTPRVPDTSPYSEHAVIQSISATGFVVWEGNSQSSGINLGFEWICVGT